MDDSAQSGESKNQDDEDTTTVEVQSDQDTADEAQPEDVQVAERELPCGNALYNIERTLGQILLVTWSPDDEPAPPVLRMRHGWEVVDPAVPIDEEWHTHVVNWMADHRDPGERDHATYLTRLAILVYCFYKAAQSSADQLWPEHIRKGTAWALMRHGLKLHDFVIYNWELADVVVNPAEDFFEKHVSSPEYLAELLDRIYHHLPLNE